MYLYPFLGFPEQKCASIMHLPVLWEADASTWSHSYVFKVGLHLLASCILYIADIHIIHQLLSVRSIHF